MNTFVVFAILIAISAADRRCPGVNFDNRYYNINVIKEGLNRLSDLTLLRSRNSLFFIFEDLKKYPTTYLGRLDMNENNANVIHGITNATSITIDQVHNKVYVGGAEGLFKINEQFIAERLPVHGYVHDVFFSDALYYVNSNKSVHKFEDGYTSPVLESIGIVVEKFVVDSDNNLFFTKGKDLFRLKLGTRAINTHELIKPNVLVTDKYRKAYVCTDDGVYVYNKYKFVFDKVADLPGLKAITFNNRNEPIYAMFDFILELKLSQNPCYEI